MNIFNIQNFRWLFNAFIAFFITGSLSSCVSISKIRYLEPIGPNKNDWEVKKTKDNYFWNFYDLSLAKKNNTTDPLAVNFDFHFNALYLWFWDHPWFDIEMSGANFMEVNTDNLILKKELDSLKKINTNAATKQSYKKPSAHLVGDSLLVIEDLSNYINRPVSNQRLYAQYRLKRGDKLKIVTGNKTLDSLFNRYKFLVKVKTRVGLAGLGLLGGI